MTSEKRVQKFFTDDTLLPRPHINSTEFLHSFLRHHFLGETSGGITKCQLFSHAIKSPQLLCSCVKCIQPTEDKEQLKSTDVSVVPQVESLS